MLLLQKIMSPCKTVYDSIMLFRSVKGALSSVASVLIMRTADENYACSSFAGCQWQ